MSVLVALRRLTAIKILIHLSCHIWMTIYRMLFQIYFNKGQHLCFAINYYTFKILLIQFFFCRNDTLKIHLFRFGL